MHELESAAVEDGQVLRENQQEQDFLSNKRTERVSVEDWAARLLHREILTQDKVRHYAHKRDLVEHTFG